MELFTSLNFIIFLQKAIAFLKIKSIISITNHTYYTLIMLFINYDDKNMVKEYK